MEPMSTDDRYTNGEVVAMVAPIFHKQPDELDHTVVLVISADMGEGIRMAGMRTTECKDHTRRILIMALMAVEDMEEEDFDNDEDTH